jgi:hypothetical protein
MGNHVFQRGSATHPIGKDLNVASGSPHDHYASVASVFRSAEFVNFCMIRYNGHNLHRKPFRVCDADCVGAFGLKILPATDMECRFLFLQTIEEKEADLEQLRNCNNHTLD